MKPLPIDEKRVARLAARCDAIDEESPRDRNWAARHAHAYRMLADACDLAASNARAYLQHKDFLTCPMQGN